MRTVVLVFLCLKTNYTRASGSTWKLIKCSIEDCDKFFIILWHSACNMIRNIYIFDLAAHLFPLWRFCVNIYTLILSERTKKMSSVCESSSLSSSSVWVNKNCSTYNYEHCFLVYFNSSLNLLDFHQFLQFYFYLFRKKIMRTDRLNNERKQKAIITMRIYSTKYRFFLRSVHCVKHIKCVFSFLFPFSCPNFPIGYVVIPQTSFK